MARTRGRGRRSGHQAERLHGGQPERAVLWPALLEGATREELVDRLVAKYGLDQADAERDVDMFVKALDIRTCWSRRRCDIPD